MENIDKEVIEKMNKEQADFEGLVAETMESETAYKRAVLNFFAEMLSQYHDLSQKVDNIFNTLNMVGAKEIADYFNELKSNLNHDLKMQAIEKKVEQGHKKPKKSS